LQRESPATRCACERHLIRSTRQSRPFCPARKRGSRTQAGFTEPRRRPGNARGRRRSAGIAYGCRWHQGHSRIAYRMVLPGSVVKVAGVGEIDLVAVRRRWVLEEAGFLSDGRHKQTSTSALKRRTAGTKGGDDGNRGGNYNPSYSSIRLDYVDHWARQVPPKRPGLCHPIFIRRTPLLPPDQYRLPRILPGHHGARSGL
jgi:hypothetical protein